MADAKDRASDLADRLGGDIVPDPTPPPEDQGSSTPPEQGSNQPDDQGSSTTPDDENFDADRAKRTIAAQRASEDKLKERIRELEREKMSETDRVKAERDDAIRERDELRTQNLKVSIAAAKGLPAEAVEFLQGSTQEELEVAADKLKRLAGEGTGNGTRTPDFGAGVRPPANGQDESADFSATLRRAAGRPA